jgi:NB-ARC domain
VLAALKAKLLGGDRSVAITGRGQAVGIQGMGGVGKSVLAAAVARDKKVRQTSLDGIHWVTIGQNPNLGVFAYPRRKGQFRSHRLRWTRFRSGFPNSRRISSLLVLV